jgi:hypothetical protein
MNNATATLPNGIIVERYRIIGTSHFEYRALRPCPGYQGYHSFTTIDGVTCGYVGAENLPDDLEALPAYSQERRQAVEAWQAAKYAEAHAAILEAFPEAAQGTRSMNGISLTVSK